MKRSQPGPDVLPQAQKMATTRPSIALPTGGGPATVTDMTVQLTRPGEDLPPFTVPLQKLSAGHYYAPLYDIPYSGDWRMTVRVQLGQTDEAVATSTFSVR